MRYCTLLIVALALMACDSKAGSRGTEPTGVTTEVVAERAGVEGGEAPQISYIQPGNIFGEKPNWSRQDFKVKLSVSIDQSGAVLATKVNSVSPPENQLAVEVGQFISERFKTARFEAPIGLSYPYSFEITVNLPASRDASGRLK